jgi:hypothetical protein
MSDKKPAIPADFPAELKELVIQGWSKEPEKRPLIQEFKSALIKMLTREVKVQSVTLPGDNSPTKKEEQPIPCEEVDFTQMTEKELLTNRDAGDIFVGQFIFNLFTTNEAKV